MVDFLLLIMPDDPHKDVT